MASQLKDAITDAMKSAMRAGEKKKLGTIRLILSAIKQVEVDTRKDLSDDDVLVILDKMVKQRRESISQYEQAGRDELADVEKEEIEILQRYLPEQMSAEDLESFLKDIIAQTGAESMKDMGKVMGMASAKLAGKADGKTISLTVKKLLSQ